ERKVVHTLWYPDVVDNEVSLSLGNNLPNLVLDRLENGFGRFDSGASGCANVKLDLPSVDGRKEIAAGRHQHDGSQCDDQDGGHRDDEPPRKQQPEHTDVTFAQALEAAFEGPMDAGKEAARSAIGGTVTLAFEKEADGDRRQCPRQAVGCQHCEYDGVSEWSEQEFGRSLEEHHRREYAADGERRDQGRDGDAGGPLQRGCGEIVSFFSTQAMSILDGHSRIVDEDADGERKAAERHRVDGFAEEVEHDNRCQDRKRN